MLGRALEAWVEVQKSQWRPQPAERIDSGNTGLDVYLKESERKGGRGQ